MLLAGVYATKPGVLLGRGVGRELSETIPMGIIGVLPTKISAENGPIGIGDLLVTSSTPGHAMKADFSDLGRLIGAVIGKAMEPFDGPETGIIKVLANIN